MIFLHLVGELAVGEIANHVNKETLDFCKNFYKEDLCESSEKLTKLALHNLIEEFYSDKGFRKRLISVASVEEVKTMLALASEIVEFTDDQKGMFVTGKSYLLLNDFFNEFILNQALIDFVLGLSNEYEATEPSKPKYINRLTPSYGVYPYQNDVILKIRNLFINDRKCLLHLPTGAGKTRTAISYICDFLREDPSRLVLWLADRNELCEQALAEFNKGWSSLGSEDLTSYGYFGDSGSLSLGGIDRGFLVCSAQSLWSARNSSKDVLYRMLAERTSLVVFDEAHKAAANTYSTMIEYISEASNESLLLGLTATPGRKISEYEVLDDENSYLSSIFGNNKVTMSVRGYLSPVQYLFEKNYLATPEFIALEYSDDSVLTAVMGPVFKIDAVDALSDSELRNRAILECVVAEVKNGSYIILFANTVLHARGLEGLFQLAGINAYSIDANTKNRSSIIRSYRNKEFQVLINYDVLTAGFDAPHTNVAIIARPTNSLVAYSQMAGRAMRGGEGGNKLCKIYTVNDDIPEFKSVVKAFAHWDKYWISE